MTPVGDPLIVFSGDADVTDFDILESEGLHHSTSAQAAELYAHQSLYNCQGHLLLPTQILAMLLVQFMILVGFFNLLWKTN